MEDRDRHFCYHSTSQTLSRGQDISAWLCVSPRRSDHIFTPKMGVFGVWSLRILAHVSVQSFLLIVRTDRIFTFHVPTLTLGGDMNEYLRMLGVSSI